MSFLLDTDICSAQLKSGALTHRVVQYSGRLYISTISLAELCTRSLRAKAGSHRLQGVLDLLQDVVALDLTSDVARRFGEIQAHLLDSGSVLHRWTC